MTPLRSLTVNLTGFNSTVDTLLGFGALIALVIGWVKVLGPRWRRFSRKVIGAADALVGREAIVDSITGEEKVPALPGIGVRMAHQEQQVELLTQAVAKLVDQEAAINELRHVVSRHDTDIAALQAAALERVASKVEQTEMWKVVQRIQDEDPMLDGEVVDDPSRDE